MKFITLEEHWESQRVNDAAKPYMPAPVNPHKNPDDHSIERFMAKTKKDNTELISVGEKRLKFMDDNDIQMQVMGYGDDSPQNLDPKVAVDLCKMANDDLADAISTNPDRFGGWAALPVGDPEAAANELERAVKEKGLQGAMIHGYYDGKFFDDPMYEPIFAKAEELDVPLYFHPVFIPQSISEHYYEGKGWSELTAFTFAGAGWGWHEDLGVQMVRLILAGVFDRHPKLKIITGHWGEMVPNFLERMDQTIGLTVNLDRSISETYRNNFYITPSGMFFPAQLQLDMTEVGADHLMYSLDYPYNHPEGAAKFLTESGLSQEDQDKIAYGNAAKMLHLN
ncbi:4-oxalomesaconate hydratase [Secundilactobacillus silagincola]|uniref:4-oxalomesaconate hydratase n=1 Tax=Secundilactobacillus silagincola TaxID=1714681 RepID=A0A1Z5J3T5_9LACO|nr:amidohydrolase family protein [Secundilactobacillus silagincola]GAX08546.1 4-oxalomesaconate hydratase [Secundilactobacillus silagincola]